MAWNPKLLGLFIQTLIFFMMLLAGELSSVNCLNGQDDESKSLYTDPKARNIRDTCKDSAECQNTIQPRCWGYENDCPKWYLTPTCNNEAGWRHFSSHEEKVKEFWKTADFGYVKAFQDSLRPVCTPKTKVGGSSLVCSKHLSYCKAENLYIDLRDDGRSLHERFKSNMFKKGQIGGFCEVDPQAMKSLYEGYRMELTSWYDQIETFSSIQFNFIKGGRCDIIEERPTFFMKLDAVVNMYHHFCDFFNLYATLHVNGSFSDDVNIVLWESNTRYSLGNFEVTWKAFTKHPIIYFGHKYAGKRVCFKKAIFSLLPRMIFGLFYNTPLIPGCSNSGLFKAFSEYVLRKLKIDQERRTTNITGKPIRVTFLSRGTKFRAILNEDKLVEAARTVQGVEVQTTTYSWDMPFLDQLKITHNTDLFIGMHGAGLTHALFLPDWALLFELYNCGDQNCYKDLARLRGLKYMTWEKDEKVFEKTKELHPEYTDHPKFRNYEFDVDEFLRLFKKAVSQVKKNLSNLSITSVT